MIDVDLSDADLSGADLTGALVDNARLNGTLMRGTTLTSATIRLSHLMGADLATAHFDAAVLEHNQHDTMTKWPSGFVPPASETVMQEPIAGLDLATYLAWRARRPSRAP